MQNAGISSVLASNAKFLMPNTELKEGQIVIGKVNELSEDGTARIIINGKIITATVVEETLSKGKFYFQVQDFKDNQLELKVISEIKQNDQKNALQILNELDIPYTKEAESVIKLFLQSEHPINKSEIITAINQLPNSQNKQLVLDTLSFLLNKNYPITEKLIDTLMNGTESQLTSLLANIEELQIEPTMNANLKQLQSMVGLIKNNHIISNFQTEQYHLANRLLTSNDESFLNEWNNQFSSKGINNTSNFKQEVFNNLVKVSENSPSIAKAFLTSLSELPEFQLEKTDLMRIPLNLSNQLFSDLDEQINPNLQKTNEIELNQQFVKNIQDKISGFLSTNSDNHSLKNSILTNVLANLNDDKNMDSMTKLYLQNQILDGSNTSSDESMNKLFEQISKFNRSNNSTLDIHTEQLTKQLMKHNELIGLNLENKLSHLTNLNKSVISEQFPTLKEIALRALNSPIPEAFKEPIEQLITKITAQQITSIHQNGPQYHLSTSIPINLNNWSTDLLIQWSGKEDQSNQNQIQSNYCHVLFFLELETLKETMVDVSIQNRVVNVTIFNNKEGLNDIVSNAQQIIKDGLAKHDYYLSSLKCLPFQNEQKQRVKEIQFNNSLLSNKEYAGVDLLV
ncbi:hypothetical protein [Gottfriedia luciferensis]|uniref:hypothetical protein n=1 Tax=Gottfriedia luciferensis TaxID=178774 RepID=UPI000B43C5E3|nr:hypothetical protein [Gottfriedia luciferensis]